MGFIRENEPTHFKNENTGVLVFAAIASFGWALVMAVIVLLQIGVGTATGQKDITAVGYWNFLVVILYVFIGTGVLLRKKWAWDWGIGTNVINALWGIIQLFDGVLLNVLLIPIEILITIALYYTRPSRSLSQEYGGRAFIPTEENKSILTSQSPQLPQENSAQARRPGMWTCSKHHANNESALFCVECGEAFVPSVATCAFCGAACDLVSAFCGKCGKPVGQVLSHNRPPSHSTAPTPSEVMHFSSITHNDGNAAAWRIMVCTTLGVIALAAAAYVSPWICLYNLRDALLKGDDSAIDRYVDFVALRSNIKVKANRYVEMLSKEENGLVRMSAGLLVDQYLNPVVMEKFVNPQTVALLFSNNEELSVLKPITEKLRSALQSESLNGVPTLKYQGVSTFVIRAKVPEADSERLCRCRVSVDVIFKRHMLMIWKVTDIVIEKEDIQTKSASSSSSLGKSSAFDAGGPAEPSSSSDLAGVKASDSGASSEPDQMKSTERYDATQAVMRNPDSSEEADGGRGGTVHRIGEGVSAPAVLSMVRATYPPLAKQARIQGTVRFNAVIAKDGSIQNLQVVSGHPLLIPAATEAVRQWIYKPTQLNGDAVDVQTQIDVNFTLSN